MTSHELDAEQLLGALGALQRAEHAELARLDEPARELAAREPVRLQAFEARLLRELCPLDARRPRRIVRRASLAVASCALAAAGWLMVRAPAAFDVSYALVPPAADALMRGAPLAASGSQYTLGRTLEFLLRPAVRYGGQLRVLAYATSAESGTRVQLQPDVELDPAGGARVRVATGAGSQLESAGSWELQFYVSPDSTAAVSDAELRARRCPTNTRCLTFGARFVQPQSR